MGDGQGGRGRTARRPSPRPDAGCAGVIHEGNGPDRAGAAVDARLPIRSIDGPPRRRFAHGRRVRARPVARLGARDPWDDARVGSCRDQVRHRHRAPDERRAADPTRLQQPGGRNVDWRRRSGLARFVRGGTPLNSATRRAWAFALARRAAKLRIPLRRRVGSSLGASRRVPGRVRRRSAPLPGSARSPDPRPDAICT